MASILPKEALPDLKKIAGLEGSVFGAFVSALKLASPTLTWKEFSEKVSKSLENTPTGDIETLLGTVFRLYRLKERSGHSAAILAEAASQLAQTATEPAFSAGETQLLKQRVQLLLECDNSVGVTAKALDVMTEHEHVFCRARILSDLRPVFTDSLETASAAVIIHNLQIGFHHDGEHKEFYVALDSNDLAKLKALIERAEKKETALQSMLAKSNTPYLKV